MERLLAIKIRTYTTRMRVIWMMIKTMVVKNKCDCSRSQNTKQWQPVSLSQSINRSRPQNVNISYQIIDDISLLSGTDFLPTHRPIYSPTHSIVHPRTHQPIHLPVRPPAYSPIYSPTHGCSHHPTVRQLGHPLARTHAFTPSHTLTPFLFGHSFPLTHSLTPSQSFTHSLSLTQSARCVWDRVYVRGSKFLYRLTNQCLCLPVFTPGRDMWSTGLVFTQLFTGTPDNDVVSFLD